MLAEQRQHRPQARQFGGETHAVHRLKTGSKDRVEKTVHGFRFNNSWCAFHTSLNAAKLIETQISRVKGAVLDAARLMGDEFATAEHEAFAFRELPDADVGGLLPCDGSFAVGRPWLQILNSRLELIHPSSV
jgi:hypothetical protein